MIYKRTLILNDIGEKDCSKKGVLTLESIDNKLVGNLRLFNIDGSLLKNTAVGLNVGNEILKLPVEFKDNNTCDFKTKNILDLGGKISCALVDTTRQNSPQIIVGGASNYHQEWANKLEQAFCLDEEPITSEEMYSLQDDEIEAVVTKTLQDDQEFVDCTQCTKCKYREAFFVDKQNLEQDNQTEQENQLDHQDSLPTTSQEVTTCGVGEQIDVQEPAPDQQENDQPEQLDPDLQQSQPQTLNQSQFINLKADESESIADDASFYEQVKSQIDDLFEQYSREQTLEQLLPNSKWVRVRYENSQNFYVLGLDTTINAALASGEMFINNHLPLVLYSLFEELNSLRRVIRTFKEEFIEHTKIIF